MNLLGSWLWRFKILGVIEENAHWKKADDNKVKCCKELKSSWRWSEHICFNVCGLKFSLRKNCSHLIASHCRLILCLIFIYTLPIFFLNPDFILPTSVDFVAFFSSYFPPFFLFCLFFFACDICRPFRSREPSVQYIFYHDFPVK